MNPPRGVLLGLRPGDSIIALRGRRAALDEEAEAEAEAEAQQQQRR